MIKLIEAYILKEAKCPKCGDTKAYVGFNSAECTNKSCSNFSQKQYDDVNKSSQGFSYSDYDDGTNDQIIDRDKYWHNKNGELHRDGDKPAAIENNAGGTSLKWYKNGVQHRDGDKPAYIFILNNGGDELHVWYKNGKRHRDGDKPALVSTEGKGWKRWYQNDQLHRDGDKPAVENGNGSKRWYQNGQLHRIGGPAVVDQSAPDEYWEYGIHVK